MMAQDGKPALYLLICCLGLFPAFGVPAEQAGADAGAAAPADQNTVQREWAETVDALKTYSAAQRDAAVARAEQTLDAMDKRIEALEARTRQQWDKLTESARQAREDTLRTLRAQRNRAAEWYGGMKHSSAGAWESVKQGFIDSYGALSDSFGKAWNQFGDDEEATQ